MTIAILAFAAGIVWLQSQALLPGCGELGLMAVVAALLCLVAVTWRRWRSAALVAAFLFGIAWSGWLASVRLADQLPFASEGRDIDVVGVVTEMPQITDHGVRFRFGVEHSALPVPQQISLTWYSRRADDEESPTALATPLHAGERWHFVVRLKRPHGNLNPDGFDYEAWLFERNIRATGYIRAAPEGVATQDFVPGFTTGVERLREIVRSRYLGVLGERPYAGILVALSVGDQQAIAPGLWQRFNRTGLTHLMSIGYLLKHKFV